MAFPQPKEKLIEPVDSVIRPQPCEIMMMENVLMAGNRKRGKTVGMEYYRLKGNAIVVDAELQRAPASDVLHVQGFYTPTLPPLIPLLQSLPGKAAGRECRIIVDGTASIFRGQAKMDILMEILGTGRHVKLGFMISSWRLVGYLGPNIRGQFDHVFIWEMEEQPDWRHIKSQWGEGYHDLLKNAPKCTRPECAKEGLGIHSHHYLHAGPGQKPHLHAPFPLNEPR